MMHLPEFKLTSKTAAIGYHFREMKPLGGWAICTVNDSTGELNVQSDWGSWSYRWNIDHTGSPSLTHFIAGRTSGGAHDCHYLADKLWGKGYGGREFSADATVKEMRRSLCKERLEQGRGMIENARDLFDEDDERIDMNDARVLRYADKRGGVPLTAGIARDLWDALGGDLRDLRNGDHFCERFLQVDCHEWITEEPWECLASEEASAYTVLVKSILPALSRACDESVKQSAEPTPPPQEASA